MRFEGHVNFLLTILCLAVRFGRAPVVDTEGVIDQIISVITRARVASISVVAMLRAHPVLSQTLIVIHTATLVSIVHPRVACKWNPFSMIWKPQRQRTTFNMFLNEFSQQFCSRVSKNHECYDLLIQKKKNVGTFEHVPVISIIERSAQT